MYKQLRRSKKDKIIGGVCGGLAEYLSIDPTIVRVICLIICLTGTGIFAYIIAMIIIPEDTEVDFKTNEKNETGRTKTNQETNNGDYESEKTKYNPEKNKIIVGSIFVGLGILLLGKLIIPWFDLKYLIPILLIAIGGLIIFKGRK